jgi:hypothetical protein
MSPGGNFVVVWASYNQDGSGWGIFGQRYNSQGLAVGGEFRINTYSPSDQTYPDVAMDANGDFIVTWTSSGEDGSGWGVYAQRYNAAGAAVGGEFRVNTTTKGDQTYPSVAMDSVGDAIIVWQSQNQDGSGWGIYGQLYNASGVVVGGEFRINTTTSGDQTSPGVAMDSAGDFTVVWVCMTQGSGPTVDAQRYNSQGATLGGEFQVNTTLEASVSHPAVAMDLSGDLLFTWSSYFNPASAQWNVYGRQFNSNGVALGSEFQVNTSAGYNQMDSNAAMNNQGQVVVGWAGGSTQDSAGIYMQRFTISFVGLESPSGDTLYAEGEKAEAHARHEPHTGRGWSAGRLPRSIGGRAGQVVHATTKTSHLWSGASHRFHFPFRGTRGRPAGHSIGGSTGASAPA